MLGLQLYSVREALAADFEGTLRKVAAMGYRAVELAGIYGESPEKTLTLLSELNLTITSGHMMLPLDSAAVESDCPEGQYVGVCVAAARAVHQLRQRPRRVR